VDGPFLAPCRNQTDGLLTRAILSDTMVLRTRHSSFRSVSRAAKSSSTSSVQRRADSVVYTSPRIAIVDDDEAISTLLRLALSDEGYEVVCWTGACDPLAFIRSAQPDLVLLDLRLFGKQRGIAIIEALRGDPTQAALPIIVCSADAPALTHHEPWLTRRGVAVLPKPFDLDDLFERVARAVSGS
jgi:CheY-like chemotaxis protein